VAAGGKQVNYEGISDSFVYSFSLESTNPILHTVWLDIHVLTLKNYTAKYYEVRKI
jgi:hypothetical protein